MRQQSPRSYAARQKDTAQGDCYGLCYVLSSNSPKKDLAGAGAQAPKKAFCADELNGVMDQLATKPMCGAAPAATPTTTTTTKKPAKGKK